jgi:ribosome-associated toxin RatA of RatAB toxin-antitoxin module
MLPRIRSPVIPSLRGSYPSSSVTRDRRRLLMTSSSSTLYAEERDRARDVRSQQEELFRLFPSARNWSTAEAAETKVHVSRRLLRYRPEQVYSVVSDVGRYKEFVPHCRESRILARPTSVLLLAELAVGFGPFEERFTSRVTLEPPRMVRAQANHSHLFHFLLNSWRFEPTVDGHCCWTEFAVAFRWRSSLHRVLTELVFDQVYRRTLQAFELRCAQLFPSSPPPAVPTDATAAATATATSFSSSSANSSHNSVR